MTKKGLIHIYTGDGKGKTTASLGLIMRATGAGMNILFTQFLKGQDTSELKTLAKLGVTVVRTEEILKFVAFMNEKEKIDCKNIHEMCYNKMKRMLLSGDYDMVILDEVMATIELNLISLEMVLELLAQKPPHVELIMTGRNAPPELVQLADYVSDIQVVKHPYDNGIQARKGIEY